jgi:hypothetical protein
VNVGTNTSTSLNAGTITANIVHINEAPTVTTLSSSDLPVVYTAYGDSVDTAADAGVTVAAIIDRLDASGLYIDNDIVNGQDVSSNRGLAIVSATTGTSNGYFEYSINGGLSWAQIPSTLSTSSALLLSYSETNRIRLRPTLNKTGLTKILVAFGWDKTDGAPNGSLKNISRLLGGSEAYSKISTSVVVNTSYTNRRPVIGTPSVRMPSVNGNNANNNGFPIVNLVDGPYLNITDRDAGDSKGVAIINYSIPADLSGIFEYKMNYTSPTWISFSLNGSNGLFLKAPPNTSTTTSSNIYTASANIKTSYSAIVANVNPYSTITGPVIRFRPFNSPVEDRTVSLTVRAWDATEGAEGIQTLSGLTTSLSSMTASLLFTVLNSSPTVDRALAQSKAKTFRADNRLTPQGGTVIGLTVTQILNDMNYVDTSGALRGMAIVDTTTLNGAKGTWSYRNRLEPWKPLPSIKSSAGRAFFLREFTDGFPNRIRFDSTANLGGLPTFSFYAWDQTNPLPATLNATTQAISSSLMGSGKPLSASPGKYAVIINAIPKK